MRAAAALVLTSLLLAACGDDEERAARPSPERTRIDVVVTHAGPGRREVSCAAGCDEPALRELLARTRNQARACTEQYGGPEVAHVTGTIAGAPVDFRVRRTNGCQIADYEALFAAVGEPAPIGR